MSHLKGLLDAGSLAVGIQLRFGSPGIAEMAGLAGFDWLLLDTEHAPQSPAGVQAQLQAIGCTKATPIVRLGHNDPSQIRLYLDMGAAGIAVAFIETAVDAKMGADACRYPPRGTRGWGPHRAAGYGLDPEGYTSQADNDILFLPIIETAAAVDNIDSILAVDGVDSCIVGPVDLCYSMGIPFQFDHLDYLQALDRVCKAALKEGKVAGVPLLGDHKDKESVRRQVEQGARLLLVGGDESGLADAFKGMLQPLAHLREPS